MSDLKKEQTERFLDYINDDFFIEIVENKLNLKKEDFKLRLVLLQPATGANENYTSVLYRAKIKIQLTDGTNKTVQVIVKALLNFLPPEFKEFNIFYRERRMYELILPILEDIWKTNGVDIQFGPKSIKFETEPYEIIVLDDLFNYDYKMQDRKIGIDLDHGKKVLFKLAKFHAASALHFLKVGSIYNELDRHKSMPPVDTEKPNPLFQGFNSIVSAFCEHVKSWPSSKDFVDTLNQWDYPKGIMSFIEVANPMKCGFRVLNHADLWVNNFMFRYNEDQTPAEVLYIDFQGSFWGSPVNDLIYFIISSIRDDIKIEKFDYLIEYYHSELVKNLETLKYPEAIPTLADIHIDMLEKGCFANLCLMMILFVVKYDAKEEISIEDLMKPGPEQQELLERVYKVENYVKAVQLLLPFMKKRGFLNCMIKTNTNPDPASA